MSDMKSTVSYPAVPEAIPATPPPGRRFGGYAALVAAGILLSRIAGLIRTSVFAHFLGASRAADAFNVAPQVAEFRELTLELPSAALPAGVSAEALEGMSWREALEPALGGSIALRVELVALDGKTFSDEFTVPARVA